MRDALAKEAIRHSTVFVDPSVTDYRGWLRTLTDRELSDLELRTLQFEMSNHEKRRVIRWEWDRRRLLRPALPSLPSGSEALLVTPAPHPRDFEETRR